MAHRHCVYPSSWVVITAVKCFYVMFVCFSLFQMFAVRIQCVNIIGQKVFFVVFAINTHIRFFSVSVSDERRFLAWVTHSNKQEYVISTDLKTTQVQRLEIVLGIARVKHMNIHVCSWLGVFFHIGCKQNTQAQTEQTSESKRTRNSKHTKSICFLLLFTCFFFFVNCFSVFFANKAILKQSFEASSWGPVQASQPQQMPPERAGQIQGSKSEYQLAYLVLFSVIYGVHQTDLIMFTIKINKMKDQKPQMPQLITTL